MGIMDSIKGVLGGLMGGQQSPDGAPLPSPSGQAPMMGQPGNAPPLGEAGRKLWQSRIRRAQEHHEPFWKLADLIRSEYLGAKDAVRMASAITGEASPVNLVSSFINTTMPQLLPANPWPVVSAKKPGQQFADGARLLEARERQVFDKPATYKHLRRALLDAECMVGFVLIGWQANTSAMAVQPPPQGQNTDGNNEPVRELTEDPSALEPDEPYARHIPYRDVFRDPDSKSHDDVEWVGYRTRKRLADVKAKEGTLYHNTDQLRGWGGHSEHDRDDETQTPNRDKRDELVELFTIFTYGRRKGELRVIVLGGNTYVEIRSEYVDFGSDGFPIRAIQFGELDRLFPPSVVQFWLDLHTTFNEFVCEATERAAESKNLIFVPDDETRDKVANASGNQIIVTKDSNMVGQAKVGGNSPETYQSIQMFERLSDKISGITDVSRGVGQEGDQTATATSLVAQATASRIGDMANAVNRWLREIATDMGGMLLTHQWQEVPVKLAANGGQQQWGAFSTQSVPGPITAYDLDFDVSDHARQTPALKAKRAQDRLALMADPNIQQLAAREGVQMSVIEALRDLLEATGERDIDRYLIRMPSPQQVQQQQIQQQQQQAGAENQAMMNGQQVAVNPATDNHQVHVAIHYLAATKSPTAAEHMSEHYALLQSALSQQLLAMNQNPQQQPPPHARMHKGPARAAPSAMHQQNEAALAGAAGRV